MFGDRDEEELRKSFSELGDSLCDSNTSRPMKRVGSSGKPLSEDVEPSGTLLYMNGFLVRKVHADSDGKKSTESTRALQRQQQVHTSAAEHQRFLNHTFPTDFSSTEREKRLENLLCHPERAHSLPPESKSFLFGGVV